MAVAAPQDATFFNVRAYSYDAQHHGAVASSGRNDRGPPASVPDPPAIAVELTSRGAAARSGAASSPATPTYDAMPAPALGDVESSSRHGGPIGPMGASMGISVSVSLGGVAAKAVPDGSRYSVAFEMKLQPGDLGRSRSVHFNRANAALDGAMRSDAQFAAAMEDMIPGVGSSVARAGGRATPDGWVWHHVHSSQAGGELGVMRLVPGTQHSPGSIWWGTLHPGGLGGYSEWAIPRGASAN